MDGNCKCKCPACGAEKPMVDGEACAMCDCGASLEKVCDAPEPMEGAEEESENGGGCGGGCCD